MRSVVLRPQWLGRVSYAHAWRLQKLRRAAVVAQQAPEAFWLLEHAHVITLGRRSVDELTNAENNQLGGVPIIQTERGGLATYHGPGQLVGYLMLNRKRYGLTVSQFVCRLEAGLIQWCSEQGLSVDRRDKAPGVWVGRNKIAAIGLHFSHGVSMHGFALNVHPDLSYFERFTPCGIRDGGITSLAAELGHTRPLAEIAEEVGSCVLAALMDSCVDTTARRG